ncbi:MAG: DUF1573 domain-containing protein [Fimbriiglobus sp.]|jgi:hypothetical protein|nr:DUF1573 domain-containing protein [Fimbriiglobus sp.]
MWRFLILFVVGIVGVALAGIAGTWAGNALRSQPSVTTPPVSLYIPPAELNFGDVWEQDSLSWPVTIENRSESTKEITRLSGSCTCQSFSPTTLTLQPGERKRVEVTLNLRPDRSRASSEPTVRFETRMWATVKGEPNDISWSLGGTVRSAVRCPDRLDLGRISELAPDKGRIEFWIETFAESAQVDVRADTPVVRIDLTHQDRWTKVTVTPERGLARREYSTSLTLSPVRDDGTTLPAVHIPLRFEVGPDVVAVPAVVNFGDRTFGEEVSETVTLTSGSGRKLTVTNVSPPAGLSARPTNLPDLLAFDLAQRAEKSTDNAQIVFTLTDDADQTHTVAVSIRLSIRPRPEKQP